MRLILYGPTALAWWVTARTRPEARGTTDDSVLQSGGVSATGLAYLRERCSGCLPVAGWWRCAGRNGLRVCAAAHAICDVRTVAADCRSVGLWLRAS